MQLILDRSWDWNSLSRRVRKEQRNRETFYPTVSTYRWWARRSHALIGRIIERAQTVLGPEIVISDPMAGGGTVAVEAARRGLKIHAQDINPWAAFGLKTTLEPVDPQALRAAADVLLDSVTTANRRSYPVIGKSKSAIITQLHVRRLKCTHCHKENYLYPTALVALDTRVTNSPKSGWFGCPACGTVHPGSWPKGPAFCPQCRFHYTDVSPDTRRIVQNAVACAHCGSDCDLTTHSLAKADWAPALAFTAKGRELSASAMVGPRPMGSRSRSRGSLEIGIPPQGETAALLRGGYREWRDLFPPRQLSVIERAVSLVKRERMAPAVRNRLLLAVGGFAEMAGYACRWDPKYRKTYEVTANHHYSRVFLSAETNPIAPWGRGTLKNRLGSAVRAAEWFPGSAKASVTCGSSETQPVPPRSIDLVVTDPPYYDSIQYAELSRLFRVFAGNCGFSWTNDAEKREAVANPQRGCPHDEYVRRLTAIFQETARTLKRDGRMLLTFHDHQLIAWEAVANSLRDSGWRVIGVAVVDSENNKDFAKLDKNAITADAVFECVLRRYHPSCPVLSRSRRTLLSLNLLAVAVAVAAVVNGKADDIRWHYFDQLRRRRVKKALLT